MKNYLKRQAQATRQSIKRLFAVCMLAMAVMFSMVVPAFATPTPPPTLDINFDITTMFSWAQTIINAMLPVVYIIMGVSLGFLIVRAFKTAFN